MKRQTLFLCLLLCLLTSPLQAQTDWQKLVMGQTSRKMPTKVGELSASWHHLRIDYLSLQKKESGGMLGALMQAPNPPIECYSLGEVVTIESHKLLVACTPNLPSINMSAISKSMKESDTPPEPEELIKSFMLKADNSTPLEMLLLPLDRIRTLNDLGPFNPADIAHTQSALDPSTILSAAIMLPVFAAARTKAKETTSLSNLKSIGLGILMYTEDYDERLPRLKDLSTLKQNISPYVKSDKVFTAPKPGIKYLTNPYISMKNLAIISDPGEMVVVYESDPAPGKRRAVLYLDGHTRLVTDTEWRDIKRTSHIP